MHCTLTSRAPFGYGILDVGVHAATHGDFVLPQRKYQRNGGITCIGGTDMEVEEMGTVSKQGTKEVVTWT